MGLTGAVVSQRSGRRHTQRWVGRCDSFWTVPATSPTMTALSQTGSLLSCSLRAVREPIVKLSMVRLVQIAATGAPVHLCLSRRNIAGKMSKRTCDWPCGVDSTRGGVENIVSQALPHHVLAEATHRSFSSTSSLMRGRIRCASLSGRCDFAALHGNRRLSGTTTFNSAVSVRCGVSSET